MSWTALSSDAVCRWTHPDHVPVARQIREMLRRATGDPAGWGPIDNHGAWNEAMLLVDEHFRLGPRDVTTLAEMTGDRVAVPATPEEMLAALGKPLGGVTRLEDAPIAGAACGLLGMTDAQTAVHDLMRHYVVIVSQRCGDRLFKTDYADIGLPFRNDVAYYMRKILSRDKTGISVQRHHTGAVEAGDLRVLALDYWSYYVIPMSDDCDVSGVVRGLFGLHDPQCDEGPWDCMCGCDIFIPEIRRGIAEQIEEARKVPTPRQFLSWAPEEGGS